MSEARSRRGEDAAVASGELARIAMLEEIFATGAPRGGGVTVGIGDDAAVFEDGLVWTIDAQIDGTHFRLGWLSLEDVGYRTFMAAASDLAAMGAAPLSALSALVLPSELTDADLAAIARGQAAAASEVGAPIVGGNLARGTALSVTTTLLGRAEHPVLRRGARPGDEVWISGAVGLAAAGLAALARGDLARAGALAPALAAWRRPRARIAEGLAMARAGASAAIDVSDGLAGDLGHVADASSVTVAVDADAILAHGGAELADAAAAVSRDPLDLALHGGEDYAVVATSPTPIAGFVRIGRVLPRRAEPLLLATREGLRPIAARGFDHFADAGPR